MEVSLVAKVLRENVVPFFLAACVMILLNFNKKKNSKVIVSSGNPPPGPKGYPIFGIFPSMVSKPAHLVFDGWTKLYGSIFKFQLGPNASVVLGDAETVRNAMLSKDSAMDSRCQWRECFIKTFKGISVLPYSRKWANTRARTMKILKDMGMGKSKMEINMNEEIDTLIESMVAESRNGEVSFQPREYLRRSPMNIICLLMFGEKYDYGDSKSLYLMNLIVKLVNILAKASVFDILPKQLRRIAGFSLFDFHDTLNKVGSYIEGEIEETQKSNRTRNYRYFVSEWLKEVDAEEKRLQNDVTLPRREFSQLKNVMQDVLIAGAHSTGVLLNWIVLFLSIHQDEQEKLFQELAEVVGVDCHATNSDRLKLVRMEAFLHESHRVATILPLVAHATCLDTKVNGYDVPKNIEVIYNNWSINHDENIFPDPLAFKPDRWVNEEGNMRSELQEKFFPYGIGKRSCAGKSLAKMQIFLTTAAIVQKLHVLPPDEKTIPEELKPAVIHQVGMMAECKPYLIRMKMRDHSC